MACPKCKCKTTYPYNSEDDFGFGMHIEEMERCAHCGTIFFLDEAIDEEDD